ncbi:MAG: phosphate acyltransferase PlsX [Planctomycetota bacterium]
MTANRIALDVMGGDDAPEALIQGALHACTALGTLRIAPERIVLVGDSDRTESLLVKHGGNPGFVLRHASEVIGMDEKPAQALRAKKDASISSAVAAVRSGEAGAVVSMGNTGACVGAATLGLGTLEGVRRPGIAVTLDLTGHPVTLIDMGANIAPKPDHLFQYGVMGAVYASRCLGTQEPRIGLLNIGEEADKGTDLMREAHRLLESSPHRFEGNLEGGDIFRDRADVVITDGFTGNVILKLMEEFSGFMLKLVLKEFRSHAVQWGDEALEKVRRTIDYAEYGGALLLGVRGTVVIGHGRSDAMAVANAVGLACRAIDAGVNAHIVDGLAHQAGVPDHDP